MENKAEVIDYVLRKLGSPPVHIELNPAQLGDAVDDALRLFDRYLYLTLPQAFQDQGGLAGDDSNGVWCSCPNGDYTHQFPLGTICASEVCPIDGTALEDATSGIGAVVIDWPTGVTGVLRCMALRPTSYRTIYQASVFELMFRMYPSRIPVGEFAMLKMFYEMYQKVRGTDPTWTIDQEARKLYVDCASGPYDIFVLWASDMTLVSLLTGSHRRWQQTFLDACLALAKERLVLIRGKFGGIPSPGGALTTDAERLARESTETLTAVKAELAKAMRGKYVPRIG